MNLLSLLPRRLKCPLHLMVGVNPSAGSPPTSLGKSMRGDSVVTPSTVEKRVDRGHKAYQDNHQGELDIHFAARSSVKHGVPHGFFVIG